MSDSIGFMDRLRNCGRTERMVKAALRYSLENDCRVFIVFRVFSDWQKMRRSMNLGDAQIRNIVPLSSTDALSVDMQHLEVRGVRPEVVFFDHCAVWKHHRKAIEEWARFAPQMKEGR